MSLSYPNMQTIDVAKYNPVPSLENVLRGFESLRIAVSCASGPPACPSLNFDLQVAHELVTNMSRHIHYLQNASRPIMRLPPEIVLHIFKLTRGASPEYSHASGDDVGRGYSIRWMRVLRVCSYWRDLANSCPALWDSIRLSGYEGRARIKRSRGDFPRLFLARSSQHPLRVAFSHKAEVAEGVRQLLEHLPRIVHLDLSGCDFDDQADLFSKPADRLKTLVIDARYSRTKTFAPPLLTLFSNNLPSLCSLALKTVRLDPAISAPTVQQLHLSGLAFRTVHEFETLVTVLNAMPNLEDLECNSLEVLIPADKCGLIVIPRLRRLALKSNTGTHVLMSAIQLPPESFVTCETTFRSPEFLPLDRSRLGGLQELRVLKLVFAEQGACRVYALGKESAFQGSKLYFDHRTQNISLLLEGMLDHTEELWIQGTVRGVLVRKTFINLVDRASFVRKIVLDLLDGKSLERIVRALIPIPETPCHLPNLQDITICNPAASFDHTLRLLRTRRGRGCPIRRLKVGRLESLPNLAESRENAIDKWKREGLPELQQIVNEVEILESMPQPTMESLPICHSEGNGFWRWPSWED